jgi:hypothetical protein
MPSPAVSRLIAAPVLLAGGALSLPLAAMALDHGPGTENWIFPAQIGGMAAVGAGLGALLPKIAGEGASHGKAALIGAGAAVGAALIGDVVLFTLITG